MRKAKSTWCTALCGWGLGLLLVVGCQREPAEETPEVLPSSAQAEAVAPPLTPPFGAEAVEAAPGVVVAGRLSPEEIRAAGEEGYQTVVNLMTPLEEEFLENEAELVREAGMAYVHLPTPKPSETEDHGITSDQGARLAAVLSEKGALPAVVHCSSASRATALMVLRAVHEGRPPNEALEIPERTGKKELVPLLEETLSSSKKDPESREAQGG